MMTLDDLGELSKAAQSYGYAHADHYRESGAEWDALCAVVQTIIDRHVKEALASSADTHTVMDWAEPIDTGEEEG